jgi:site-specific DNA recombinase
MTSKNNLNGPTAIYGSGRNKPIKRSVRVKTAAIYARVSTQRQAEEETIASQVAQLEAYAQQAGYLIQPEHRFIDEAVSGKDLHRPGLNRLRDAALRGVFSTILCLSPDRLSRNLGVQQFLLGQWRQLNLDLVFIHRPRQGQTPQDDLLLSIEGAFAEYERAVISDRMQRGRRHRLRQGQSAPYPAAYGYRYCQTSGQRGSYWEIDPMQALIVEQIFVWYSQTALTTYAIAQRLNDQHVLSPGGAAWSATAVNRVLCQSAYRGEAHYGRTSRDYSGVGLPRRQGQGRLQYPRGQVRPAEEWITRAVPAIISPTLWQQAQAKRLMNQQTASRNSQRAYLLRGLLVCGVCGRTLQGRAQNDHTYYRCPNGGQSRPDHRPAHTCSVRGDKVETAVWQDLTDLLRQPAHLQQAWEVYGRPQTHSADEVSRWRQRQQKVQGQRKRLLDAYQAGLVSLEELTTRQNPLILELRQLETQLAAASQIACREISLEQFTTLIAHALEATDLETQQHVIRLLIERVIVQNDELIIEHIVPLTDNSQLEHTQCDA